jgi:competence protein ComEA
MLALAAVGAASTLAGHGVAVEVPNTGSAPPSASGVWVAPDAPAASVAAPARAPETPRSVVTSADGTPSAATAAPNGGLTADGKVILNVASADELTKLPKVGPKRAQAILELRRKLGRFRQPTDLLRVRGIGRKTLKQMLPLLVVDPPNSG